MAPSFRDDGTYPVGDRFGLRFLGRFRSPSCRVGSAGSRYLFPACLGFSLRRAFMVSGRSFKPSCGHLVSNCHKYKYHFLQKSISYSYKSLSGAGRRGHSGAVKAVRNSIVVSLSTSAIATMPGFAISCSDYCSFPGNGGEPDRAVSTAAQRCMIHLRFRRPTPPVRGLPESRCGRKCISLARWSRAYGWRYPARWRRPHRMEETVLPVPAAPRTRSPRRWRMRPPNGTGPAGGRTCIPLPDCAPGR